MSSLFKRTLCWLFKMCRCEKKTEVIKTNAMNSIFDVNRIDWNIAS